MVYPKQPYIFIYLFISIFLSIYIFLFFNLSLCLSIPYLPTYYLPLHLEVTLLNILTLMFLLHCYEV